MTTLSQIQAQIIELQRQAEMLRDQELTSVIAEIKQKMKTYNISMEDINGSRHINASRRKTGDSDRATVKAPIKFLNKTTNQSWSGRGLKPRWLTAAMEQGATLDDFSVEKESVAA